MKLTKEMIKAAHYEIETGWKEMCERLRTECCGSKVIKKYGKYFCVNCGKSDSLVRIE